MHGPSYEELLDGLDPDTVFRLLSHPRRRALLGWIDERDGPASLDDAAEALALKEAECPPAEIPPREVERVYMTLYHTHVPKLVGESFLAYERGRDAIDLTERGEKLTEVVEYVPKMGFLSNGPPSRDASSVSIPETDV